MTKERKKELGMLFQIGHGKNFKLKGTLYTSKIEAREKRRRVIYLFRNLHIRPRYFLFKS